MEEDLKVNLKGILVLNLMETLPVGISRNQKTKLEEIYG
jgi:hypothetical protein